MSEIVVVDVRHLTKKANKVIKAIEAFNKALSEFDVVRKENDDNKIQVVTGDGVRYTIPCDHVWKMRMVGGKIVTYKCRVCGKKSIDKK